MQTHLKEIDIQTFFPLPLFFQGLVSQASASDDKQPVFVRRRGRDARGGGEDSAGYEGWVAISLLLCRVERKADYRVAKAARR